MVIGAWVVPSLFPPDRTPVCSGFSTTVSAVNGAAAQSKAAYFDEQLWFVLAQNSTSLSFNVTATKQNDDFGFGPGYLVNGLTEEGLWYQVGVAWDWVKPSSNYTEHVSGFNFFYEVWNVNTNTSIYPSDHGPGLANFNGTVNDGDKVQLSLLIAQSRDIVMSAMDWNTGARASKPFPSYGAMLFLGNASRYGAHPSSLLTEWYHVLPYFCSPHKVAFSTTRQTINAGWLGIDEWNFSCFQTCRPFNLSDKQEAYFFPPSAFHDFNSSTFQNYSSLGTTIYANNHEFITM